MIHVGILFLVFTRRFFDFVICSFFIRIRLVFKRWHVWIICVKMLHFSRLEILLWIITSDCSAHIDSRFMRSFQLKVCSSTYLAVKDNFVYFFEAFLAQFFRRIIIISLHLQFGTKFRRVIHVAIDECKLTNTAVHRYIFSHSSELSSKMSISWGP